MARLVHRPKKGTILELPLGQQAEFGSPDHSITYCGMPNPDVYSLGIRGKSIQVYGGPTFPGFNLYLPVPSKGETQTLDDILEGTTHVNVVEVTPRAITLKYVK